jgi:hydroxyacylglutathione hydrolase
MSIQIIPFRNKINTCYLIKDRGAILIDAGYPDQSEVFRGFLLRNQVKPEEIKLIILTHGDFDHVGGAKELKEVTGAGIAIHDNDRRYLEEGIFHWPYGVTPWGKLTRTLFTPVIRKIASFPAVRADLVLGENDLSLEEFGIQGKIIHTPGHTSGSVSVLLDSGDAFVGCLAHNRAPFVLRPRLPIYADNIELLKESLRKIVQRGASTLYPGHGDPFPVRRILKYIN